MTEAPAEPEPEPEAVEASEVRADTEAEAAEAGEAHPKPESAEPSAQPETESDAERAEAERPEAESGEGEPGEAAAGAEQPDSEEGVEPVSDLPDVTSDEALEAALEALLLVVDSPAGEQMLAETVAQPVARVTVALRTMAQRLTERGSGIDLRRVGEGWRFYTRDTYAPFVEKLLLDGQRSKLTRAALESLAVIAYRQPVTRARVAAVRGVNVDGVIRTLLARGLIEEMGTDPETTGTLYVTTELFLERLGLSSLNDLPPIAPLLPEVDTIDDI
ncbi:MULTISPECIES: SMC-Scp complex subunit ScpB [unclassified Amycolatopsis]|uniref:SMC-Scp complex subunit ScpB n=1 Tax=unclassified Amycolatopsis TaxID=2618356 RepID=UPI0021075847|nr:SMC-Scp complex subunit ScpB [Amycolatopsis sp. DSM 110486]